MGLAVEESSIDDEKSSCFSLESQDSSPASKLGYLVQVIEMGVLVPPDSLSYGEDIARDLRRMAPDRFHVQVITSSGESEAATSTNTDLVTKWPNVRVLVACCSQPGFPSIEAQRYAEANQPLLVLTDLDLKRTLSDRRIFYNTLEAGGCSSFLPRMAVVNHNGAGPPPTVIERRDHIQIDRAIILKPLMERPTKPQENDVRIYYKRSTGGGCKEILLDCAAENAEGELAKHSTFLPEGSLRTKKDDKRSFIYEELLDETDTAERRYRKRDRIRDMAYQIVPGMERRMVSRTSATIDYEDDADISYVSDLSRMDRKIVIVTTASLPWMTGTAVNPLLQAAYLSRGRPKGAVTLVIPWLDREEDRDKVYGKLKFASSDEQEIHVRKWLRESADMPEEADPESGLRIIWYPSHYYADLGSIFATVDICKLIPDEDADVCVLEEPEHLNWFKASGDSWTSKFSHVIGVVHTNYKAYASAHPAGLIAAPFISGISTLMVRAYCHKVIKLSAVLQTFAVEKEVVCNVHGVRSEFLIEGKRRAEAALKKDGASKESDRTCAYFIGKILWAKGLDRLLRLEDFYKDCVGEHFKIDIYGDGPEMAEIKRAYHGRSSGKKRKAAVKFISRASGIFRSKSSDSFDESAGTESKLGNKSDIAQKIKSAYQDIEPLAIQGWRMNPVPAEFHGRIDHAILTEQYKVFINPSITEVLCTTTAEALAMGKFAIIPVHPSNSFFMQFPNCLAYNNKLEFAANLQWALSHEPEPLSEHLSYQFTWEAATERFITASAITMREGRERAKARKGKLDERIAYFHDKVSKQLGSKSLSQLETNKQPPGKSFGKFIIASVLIVGLLSIMFISFPPPSKKVLSYFVNMEVYSKLFKID
eukprot:scaffold17146_cov50-Attheya_sp.AAC.1